MTLSHKKVAGTVALVGGEVSVSGGIIDGQTFRWDTNTLSWVPWDGSLTTGAITIGTVNQGSAGAQMWKVDASGAVVPVSGPLTDAQLRASAVPVSMSGDIATQTTLASRLSEADFDTKAGSLTETAPATDTASSGLNGRLQRLAQRITSLLALLPSALSNGFFQVSVKETISLPVTGTFFQATQPVSAAALPLPAGAATSASQGTGNTSLASIDTKTPALVSGRQPVDGSGVTQPVSGTFFQATQPVSAAALPLPTGASTEATLGSILTELGQKTEPANQQHAVVDSSALPTGASTEATLALIKTKTDNLDVLLSTRTKPADAQHVIVDSSASIPVTGPLTDVQLRASAIPISGNVGVLGAVEVVNDAGNPLPVSGTFFQTTQPVSGPLTDTELRATPIPITGAISATSAATATAADPAYTEGNPEDLSQTLGGQLRVMNHGAVSDAPPTFLDGEIHPLSLTNDGRLRVSVIPARFEVQFFSSDEECMWGDLAAVHEAQNSSPWAAW